MDETGYDEYLNYQAKMQAEKVDTPLWEDLDERVRALWLKVSQNNHDPLMHPAARSWEAFAAISNDPSMPAWDGLSHTNKVQWERAFGMHSMRNGAFDATATKVDDPREELRRMRQYSKCFTNAYDRRQAVFVLVEQDRTAYYAIAQWINSNIQRLGAAHPKIISAKATMARFMEFQSKAQAKHPD
jgi:hypothetical protein